MLRTTKQLGSSGRFLARVRHVRLAFSTQAIIADTLFARKLTKMLNNVPRLDGKRSRDTSRKMSQGVFGTDPYAHVCESRNNGTQHEPCTQALITDTLALRPTALSSRGTLQSDLSLTMPTALENAKSTEPRHVGTCSFVVSTSPMMSSNHWTGEVRSSRDPFLECMTRGKPLDSSRRGGPSQLEEHRRQDQSHCTGPMP